MNDHIQVVIISFQAQQYREGLLELPSIIMINLSKEEFFFRESITSYSLERSRSVIVVPVVEYKLGESKI